MDDGSAVDRGLRGDSSAASPAVASRRWWASLEHQQQGPTVSRGEGQCQARWRSPPDRANRRVHGDGVEAPAAWPGPGISAGQIRGRAKRLIIRRPRPQVSWRADALSWNREAFPAENIGQGLAPAGARGAVRGAPPTRDPRRVCGARQVVRRSTEWSCPAPDGPTSRDGNSRMRVEAGGPARRRRQGAGRLDVASLQWGPWWAGEAAGRRLARPATRSARSGGRMA